MTAAKADSTGVLIHGSCVSRDAFSRLDGRPLHLVDYFARCSLASAFASAPVEDDCSARLQSSFQRRQVQRDLGKVFRREVGTLDFDLLLVDFIDERFPLFRLPDDRLVTVSSELGRSGFPGTQAGRLVPAFGDEHFSAWEAGWTGLLGELDRVGRRGTLRVNAVWWSQTLEDGSRFDPGPSPAGIERANRYLERLYARAAVDLEPGQVLRYPRQLFVGNPAHTWGPAPFHYTDAAYAAMLDQLLTPSGGFP